MTGHDTPAASASSASKLSPKVTSASASASASTSASTSTSTSTSSSPSISTSASPATSASTSPSTSHPHASITSPAHADATDYLQLKSLRTDSGGEHSTFGLTGVQPTPIEEQRIQRDIEDRLIQQLPHHEVFSLSDLLPFISYGANVIVQDDFSRCFQSAPHEPWNWNTYLYILWVIGVFVRYCILFPIRVISLLIGFLIFTIGFLGVKLFIRDLKTRNAYERFLIRFLCGAFVFSWTGVIKYHGTIPERKPNRIYVANHTSMIDMIVLSQMHTFALVGQKHPGWVGFFQDHVLASLGNAWFNRGEANDRASTARKIREHIHNPASNRLLVFPEGTCVNNEYLVQFKQGVFDMGAEICPIALKYNKIFVDAFWNSRTHSFAMHLVNLMCSWAVVCDVWYLDPVSIQPGETAIDFSNRVKKMIAERAQLKDVSWDGYLKHFRPSNRYVQERQKVFADALLNRLTRQEQRLAKAKEKQSRQRESAAALAAAAAATATAGTPSATSDNDLSPLAETDENELSDMTSSDDEMELLKKRRTSSKLSTSTSVTSLSSLDQQLHANGRRAVKRLSRNSSHSNLTHIHANRPTTLSSAKSVGNESDQKHA